MSVSQKIEPSECSKPTILEPLGGPAVARRAIPKDHRFTGGFIVSPKPKLMRKKPLVEIREDDTWVRFDQVVIIGSSLGACEYCISVASSDGNWNFQCEYSAEVTDFEFLAVAHAINALIVGGYNPEDAMDAVGSVLKRR